MLRTDPEVRRFSDESSQERSAARGERRGAARVGAIEPVRARSSGHGGASEGTAGGGGWSRVCAGRTGRWTTIGRRGGASGHALQSGGLGGAHAPAWRRAARALHERRARAHPRRGAPDSQSRARWDSPLVADDLAAGAPAGTGRFAAGEHVHDLVRAQRSGVELAAHPHLVSHRQRTPQAEAGGRDGSRPGCRGKKGLIQQAYREAETSDLVLACQDEAGPFQTAPYPGTGWAPQEHPIRQPHEYLRDGTAKGLTLFRPATGEVRVKGVTTCPNTVLHAWLKQELTALLATLLATLPEPAPVVDAEATRACWTRWQEGLQVKITLPAVLPPLRVLLVWDNLVGHHTPELVLWLFAHGVMVLYTPVGGSWLNMAESIQRILKRRALDGQHPQTPTEIIAWLEATAAGWNRAPTPFVWGGKRQA